MAEVIRLDVPVSERDHSQGQASAPVTLVQYGDYECPYTRRSTHVVRAIQQEMGEQLRFVFRNFPLTEIHPHALAAAEAAEAAAGQGRFWEMHDALFSHQHALEDADLPRYAGELGLDTARFEQDLATHAYLERIKADAKGGLLSGVQGTPTFFSSTASYTKTRGRTTCWGRPCRGRASTTRTARINRWHDTACSAAGPREARISG